MKLHAKTWALLVAAVVLLVINFADQGTGHRISSELPLMEAVDRDAATRIELSSAIEKVILEKAGLDSETPGRWTLSSPVKGDADQILVRSLLQQFRKDVPIDVKVDEGNLDQYGLDAGTGIVVEIWEGGSDPAVSFTVGNDAPGGSTFIRISGDDAIYRARIGGRRRYEVRGSDWRNNVVLDFESTHVSGMEVTRGGQTTLSFVRLPATEKDENDLPIPGDWTLSPTPEWRVDTDAIEVLVRRLGMMRAGDTLDASFDGGFEPPAAEADVVFGDGTTMHLVVGTRGGDGGAFVKVDGRDAVYRVAASTIQGLLYDASAYRDRTIFSFDKRQLDTIGLEEGTTTMLLQQDLANGLWRVIQPANVDVDLKLVFFAVNTLAELRADDIVSLSPAEAGLDDPAAVLRLTFLDGSYTSLRFGKSTFDNENRPITYVQREGDSQVFVLRDTQVEKIKKAFGRL